MKNFEKYLNEQGKSGASVSDLLKLAFESGFEEGLDVAMEMADDPGELGGRVHQRWVDKHMEKKFKEFLRDNKIDMPSSW